MECLYFFLVHSKHLVFSQVLARVCDDGFGEELASHGLTRENLGTHSIRKGAKIYASNGTNAGPSKEAINNRGQWNDGNHQKNEFLERGSDTYCGRILAGLDVLDESFALLPPHFNCNVDKEIELAFPTYYRYVSLREVLHFCLASLVFHAEKLRQLLPAHHFIFRCQLFTQPDLFESLRNKLIDGYSSPKGITASGIPPHLILLDRMKKQEYKIDAMQQTLTTSVKDAIREMFY